MVIVLGFYLFVKITTFGLRFTRKLKFLVYWKPQYILTTTKYFIDRHDSEQ